MKLLLAPPTLLPPIQYLCGISDSVKSGDMRSSKSVGVTLGSGGISEIF